MRKQDSLWPIVFLVVGIMLIGLALGVWWAIRHFGR